MPKLHRLHASLTLTSFSVLHTIRQQHPNLAPYPPSMAPSAILAARRPLLTSIASVSRPSRTTLQPITQSSRFFHCQHTRPSRPATKTTTPSIPRRKYHSTHQPTPDHEYTNSQTAILTAALRHVPQLGFTRDALTLGARDAGFLDVSVQLLPRGEFDLILFWLASRRGLLRAAVDNGLFRKNGPRELSVEQKTKMLVMERLRMNADVRNQWQDVSPPQLLLIHISTHKQICTRNYRNSNSE